MLSQSSWIACKAWAEFSRAGAAPVRSDRTILCVALTNTQWTRIDYIGDTDQAGGVSVFETSVPDVRDLRNTLVRTKVGTTVYASDAVAVAGACRPIQDSEAAGGIRLENANAGTPKLAALANPTSYFARIRGRCARSGYRVCTERAANVESAAARRRSRSTRLCSLRPGT
jgi:hypothetical protein